MHARDVDGRTHTFGHRGWLWRNAYLLYDHETDTIWHHQTGWAMAGPLRGKALARFPTVLTTFAAWTSAFPDTLVLPKPRDGRDAFAVDHYASRNVGLAFGIGVDLPNAFRLYPFEALDTAGGVVTETLDGVPLVVVRDRSAHTAYAYRREVAGRVLALRGRDAVAGPLLVDDASGQSWSARSGRALDGAAPPLERLHTAQWELDAWARQHPHGTRYPHPPHDAAVPESGH